MVVSHAEREVLWSTGTGREPAAGRTLGHDRSAGRSHSLRALTVNTQRLRPLGVSDVAVEL